MNALPSGLKTLDDPAGPSQAYFKYAGHCCLCVVCKVVESGAIVCVPRLGLDHSLFVEAESTGYTGVLGPSFEATADVQSTKPNKRKVDVLLFDLEVAGFDSIYLERPPDMLLDSITGFGIFRGSAEWPQVDSLRNLVGQFLQAGEAETRLAFYSAAEGPTDGLPDDPSAANGLEPCEDEVEFLDPIQRMLQKLLSQNEVTQRAVQGMQGKLSQLGAFEARLGRLESGAVQAAPSPSQHPGRGPHMFDQTPPALPSGAQQRLQALAKAGPHRMGDLRSSGAKVSAPVDPPTGITADVAEEEDLDGLPLEPEEHGSTLEKILASQTQLLAKLVHARTVQQDPLRLLSAVGEEPDEAPRSSGVKGISARQLLMEHFKRRPGKVTAVFRERLMLARRKSAVSDLEPRDFIAAAMFEASERKDAARLEMLVMMLAVFVEQAACDAGSLKLAHLLTCLEDPPLAQTEQHRSVKGDLVHAQLADPRWVATQLAFLKDLELMGDKASKLARPAKAAADTSQDDEKKAAPKWRPKKKKTPAATESET